MNRKLAFVTLFLFVFAAACFPDGVTKPDRDSPAYAIVGRRLGLEPVHSSSNYER